jgi:hypothetical protein
VNKFKFIPVCYFFSPQISLIPYAILIKNFLLQKDRTKFYIKKDPDPHFLRVGSESSLFPKVGSGSAPKSFGSATLAVMCDTGTNVKTLQTDFKKLSVPGTRTETLASVPTGDCFKTKWMSVIVAYYLFFILIC